MSADFFNQSISGFLIADQKGKVLDCNAAFAGWMNTTAAEIVGRRFTDLLSVGAKIYYETHLSPLLKMQGFFAEVVIELMLPDNQKLKVLLNANYGRDANATADKIYYTLVKAGDRLQYERNLQLAKDVAESALLGERETVNLREQLIAVLGHDLRNPLNAIVMATDLLQDMSTNETGSLLLDTIERSTRRMTELIANIMDFARTRLGGGIKIDRSEVLLEPVITQVVQELQLVHPKRKLNVNMSLPHPISCDAHRMAQLLSNLLANALVHGSRQHPVTIDAFCKDDTFELSVCNKGEPVPASLHKNLFEPFSRENDRPSLQGLGLGLYISSEIARAHQAVLSFTSDEEQTCFRFRMPVGEGEWR